MLPRRRPSRWSDAINTLSREYAQSLDDRDPLRAFRERFYLPTGKIYLDGNSLGLASRDAESAILNAIDDWKTQAIGGWIGGDRPWFYLAEELAARMAHLVGARSSEVIVTGTTTVNLHNLVATFYHPVGRRTRILVDELDFPSDVYALRSQIRLRGLDPNENLVVVRSRDGRTLDENELIAAMTDDIALVILPSVLYRSGQLLDLECLTAAARDRGIPIGFDCCHSVGVLPHQFHDWGTDFAFWCNYKYVNGGPGAVAGLFVHEQHFGAEPGLAGWWGSDKLKQFDMSSDFTGAGNAGAWQISTPPIFSTAAVAGALRIHEEAGIDRIRAKSLALTDYLTTLVDDTLSASPYDFSIGTPREERRRGGHIALEHPDAVRIAKALKAQGIIPDFRPPNVVRLAPIPLYTTFVELWDTVAVLRQIVDRGDHQRFSAIRETVA
jgi:kynureninase